MAKSGGDKMQAAKRKRAETQEPKESKGGTASSDKEKTALLKETERLRAQLAAERERVKTLETANTHVSERLDAAIQSVKAILNRKA